MMHHIIMAIRRRRFLLLLTSTPLLAASSETNTALRGRLTKAPGDKPALQTAAAKVVTLSGDEDTMGVLRDARLAQADFEVLGKQTGDTFIVGPIYTAALFAYKDGKRLRVTYWCDVCA